MKRLLTLLFAILSLQLAAQTQSTLPSGSVPYGSVYLAPDSSVWAGAAGKTFKKIGLRADVTRLDDSISALRASINGKVDKITGKGLSTEDYTTAEKSKLAGIAAGAEVNVNADWLAVSGDAQILNKPTFVATESDPVFLAQKGAANGVATLNSSGKVPNAQIPALALVDTYVAASQAAMLALSSAEQGDVAIRTDLSKTFILIDANYSTLASWKELLSPVIPAETDPIWGASPSAGITGTDISNWNTAYGWGNHALAGYALSSTLGNYLLKSGGTLTGTLSGTNATFISNNASGTLSIFANSSGQGLTINPNNTAGIVNMFSDYLGGSEPKLHISTYSDRSSANGLSVISGGNIGIGTVSPALKLHVMGPVRLEGPSGYLDFYDTGAGASRNWSIKYSEDVEGDWGIYVSSAAGGSASTKVIYATSNGVIRIPTLSSGSTQMVVAATDGSLSVQAIPSGGGGGTVTSVGVASSNGFAGTSTGGANPTLTISTTVSGLLNGNGTSVSAAPTTGTGNVVFSASPTFSGTINAGNGVFSGSITSLYTLTGNSSYGIWETGSDVSSDGWYLYSGGYAIKVDKDNFATTFTGAISASNFSGSSSGANTGDQINISGNAATATNVAWTGVTSRPTALSQFTNDLGNYGSWITASSSNTLTNKSGNISQWTNDAGYITSSSGVLSKGNLLISGDGTTTTFNTGLTGGTVMVVSPSSTAAIGVDYYLTQISNVWYILFPTPPANGTTVRFYAIVS